MSDDEPNEPMYRCPTHGRFIADDPNRPICPDASCFQSGQRARPYTPRELWSGSVVRTSLRDRRQAARRLTKRER